VPSTGYGTALSSGAADGSPHSTAPHPHSSVGSAGYSQPGLPATLPAPHLAAAPTGGSGSGSGGGYSVSTGSTYAAAPRPSGCAPHLRACFGAYYVFQGTLPRDPTCCLHSLRAYYSTGVSTISWIEHALFWYVYDLLRCSAFLACESLLWCTDLLDPPANTHRRVPAVRLGLFH
jgi:hypothetical protein